LCTLITGTAHPNFIWNCIEVRLHRSSKCHQQQGFWKREMKVWQCTPSTYLLFLPIKLLC
jgi:hypothetical protein